MVFPGTRTGERAVQTVEVMAQPSANQAASKRAHTFTFCLEHITQGPYKVVSWLQAYYADAYPSGHLHKQGCCAGLLDDRGFEAGGLRKRVKTIDTKSQQQKGCILSAIKRMSQMTALLTVVFVSVLYTPANTCSNLMPTKITSQHLLQHALGPNTPDTMAFIELVHKHHPSNEGITSTMGFRTEAPRLFVLPKDQP